MVTRLGIIYTFLLLSFPVGVTGGPLSYAGCMAVAVGASICGTAAILPALGFTSSGIAAGSWAATWMASMGGAVPAGSLFATLQSTGATGGAMSFTSIAGSVSGLCVALTAPLP